VTAILVVMQPAGLLTSHYPRRRAWNKVSSPPSDTRTYVRLGERSLVGTDCNARTKLHAASIGRSEEYYQSRRVLGPVDPQEELRRFFVEGSWSAQDIGTYLEAPMRRSAEADLGRAVNVLTEPGAFLAFSNGDCGLNNYLIGPDDGKVIDFEFAGNRHLVSDVACLYVPGPQWMAVGDPNKDGTEDAYRSILAPVLPQVADDAAYGQGVSAAGLLFALMRLGRLLVLDARPPGHESRRQMVSTLSAASRTARRFGCLPGLRGWVERLAEALRTRWPDADIDLAGIEPYSPQELTTWDRGVSDGRPATVPVRLVGGRGEERGGPGPEPHPVERVVHYRSDPDVERSHDITLGTTLIITGGARVAGLVRFSSTAEADGYLSRAIGTPLAQCRPPRELSDGASAPYQFAGGSNPGERSPSDRLNAFGPPSEHKVQDLDYLGGDTDDDRVGIEHL
jgi:hypothetical protein